jgi:hypothetical protein
MRVHQREDLHGYFNMVSVTPDMCHNHLFYSLCASHQLLEIMIKHLQATRETVRSKLRGTVTAFRRVHAPQPKGKNGKAGNLQWL